MAASQAKPAGCPVYGCCHCRTSTLEWRSQRGRQKCELLSSSWSCPAAAGCSAAGTTREETQLEGSHCQGVARANAVHLQRKLQLAHSSFHSARTITTPLSSTFPALYYFPV